MEWQLLKARLSMFVRFWNHMLVVILPWEVVWNLYAEVTACVQLWKSVAVDWVRSGCVVIEAQMNIFTDTEE